MTIWNRSNIVSKKKKKKERAVIMRVHVKNWESTMKINVFPSMSLSIFFFFTGMKRYKSIHLLYISFRVYVFFILLLLREKGPQLSPVSTIPNSAPSLWLYIKNHQRSFKKISVPECTLFHWVPWVYIDRSWASTFYKLLGDSSVQPSLRTPAIYRLNCM